MKLVARSGTIAVLLGVVIVALFGAASLSIDFSRLWTLRNELQGSADAGAHAGAVQLLVPNAYVDADDSASSFATRNLAMGGVVTVDSATLGHWNDEAKTFTAFEKGGLPIDAVSVVVSRQSTGLFLSSLGLKPRVKARAIGWAFPATDSDSTTGVIVESQKPILVK